MKILHLNLSDHFGWGGTAAATYSLHTALRESGIGSTILCPHKERYVSHTVQLEYSKILKSVESLTSKFTYRIGLNDFHAISSFWLDQQELFQNSDIFHLHCIHNGYFNYLALPRLTAEKPTVFTVHDMWAFTGHCASTIQCERWKTGCGNCPDLTIPPAVKMDNTALEWKLKKWTYQNSKMAIVSPSHWMTEQIKQSVLSHFPIYQIPHGIDTELYQPLDPEQCRAMLGIPKHKKVLMFAATDLKRVVKGGDLLLEALQGLPASLKAETVLLLMGSQGDSLAELVDIQACSLGMINHDRLKTIAYSAADLFVFPTRWESFGLVAIESLACGTPVVSFPSGGITDIVRTGVTGYLAEPENASDLRNGIMELLEDQSHREFLSQQGREVVLNEYAIELETQRYLDLYAHLLQEEKSPEPQSLKMAVNT